jgi:hypothetical protein
MKENDKKENKKDNDEAENGKAQGMRLASRASG